MLTRRQAVQLNCIPLLGNTANPVGVQYCSAGVVVSTIPHPTVPFTCLISSQELLDDFNIFLMKVVGKLRGPARWMEGLDPNHRFPKSFFRLLVTKNCSMMPKEEYPYTLKPAPKSQADTRKSERLLPPGFASIPRGAETVSENVKSYDTSQVIMKNGELVLMISDMAGWVKCIVTNHTALISFNQNSQRFLALAA